MSSWLGNIEAWELILGLVVIVILLNLFIDTFPQ